MRPFKNIAPEAIVDGCWESGENGYVLMRWQERSFVNCEPKESKLTISGFYVVALSRRDGSIEGMLVLTGYT